VAGALVALALVTLGAIGYASARGLIGPLSYGYGYQYQYCTGPAEYQYCSTTASTTTTGSTTTTTSSTTTTTSSTTTTTTSTTSTTTTTPKPGKGCGDKNHEHERFFQCKVTIHDVFPRNEGKTGKKTPFVFKVQLDRPPIDPVTVDFATSDGTATAPSDYVSKSGTLTKGIKVLYITITVKGDNVVEPDETFFVNLSNPSGNAYIDRNPGQGTIKNDDH